MDSGNIEKRFERLKKSSTFLRIKNLFKLNEKKVLDLGCAYGEHLVHFGPGSTGVTTSEKEVQYGKEKNIAISFGNVEKIDEIELSKDFDAVWANNLFEHLLAPHAFLMKLKTAVNDNALLILGVPVIPKLSTLLKIKKFRGSLSSAHINFFTRESLRLTVERAGWKIVAVRPFISKNKALDFLASFIAPHLYVVAKNDSKFIYPPKKVNEWEGDEHYAKLLKIGGVK